jgi:hypothetical protein
MLPIDDSFPIPERANTKLIANVYNDTLLDNLRSTPNREIFINIDHLNKFIADYLVATENKTTLPKLKDRKTAIVNNSTVISYDPNSQNFTHVNGPAPANITTSDELQAIRNSAYRKLYTFIDSSGRVRVNQCVDRDLVPTNTPNLFIYETPRRDAVAVEPLRNRSMLGG